jgi:hypothetical protein
MEKKKWGEGGQGRWPTAFFYDGSVARREEEKGQGVRGLELRGGGNGEERGGPSTTRDSSAASIGLRPTGAGGGAVARQGRAARLGDPAHAQLTDGAERSWCPVAAAGCGME